MRKTKQTVIVTDQIWSARRLVQQIFNTKLPQDEDDKASIGLYEALIMYGCEHAAAAAW